jgi:hypothetical protein
MLSLRTDVDPLIALVGVAGFTERVSAAVLAVFGDELVNAGVWRGGLMAQEHTPAAAHATATALRTELQDLMPQLEWAEDDTVAALRLCHYVRTALPAALSMKVASVVPLPSSASAVSSGYEVTSTSLREAATAVKCWADWANCYGRTFVPAETERLDSSMVAKLRTQAASAGTWRFFTPISGVQTDVQKVQRGETEVHLGGGVSLGLAVANPSDQTLQTGPILYRLDIFMSGMMAAFCFEIPSAGASGSLPGSSGYYFAQGEATARRWFAVTLSRNFTLRALKASHLCTARQLADVINRALLRLIDVVGETLIHPDDACVKVCSEREPWVPDPDVREGAPRDAAAGREGREQRRQAKPAHKDNLREGTCNSWSRTGACPMQLCPWRRSHTTANKPAGTPRRDDRRDERRDDRRDDRDYRDHRRDPREEEDRPQAAASPRAGAAAKVLTFSDRR